MRFGQRPLPAIIRDFDSDILHRKLASGGLAEKDRAIVIEELARREDEKQERHSGNVQAPSTESNNSESLTFYTETPFESGLGGWGFWPWAILIVLCIFVVASFGTTPRNHNDQHFAYGMIVVGALCLAVTVRAMGAIFASKNLATFAARIVVFIALCYALYLFSFFYYYVVHGYKGG